MNIAEYTVDIYDMLSVQEKCLFKAFKFLFFIFWVSQLYIYIFNCLVYKYYTLTLNRRTVFRLT